MRVCESVPCLGYSKVDVCERDMCLLMIFNYWTVEGFTPLGLVLNEFSFQCSQVCIISITICIIVVVVVV